MFTFNQENFTQLTETIDTGTACGACDKYEVWQQMPEKGKFTSDIYVEN